MGRLRKTTAELDRKGAFDKNPQRGRARAGEPTPTGPLGPPPAEFLDPHSPTARDHLRAWNELLDEAKEVKLTSADRGHMEMTARLRVRCRRPGAKTGDFSLYDKYASKLGLNPASRSLVAGVGKKDAQSERSDWAAAASGSDGLSVVQ